MRITHLLVLFILSITLNGCAILFGNVEPVSEKDSKYTIEEPAVANQDWQKFSYEESDLSFQSKKTKSIMSMNSACRTKNEVEEKDLKEFTDILLMGVTHLSHRKDRKIKIQEIDALETTVQGKVDQQDMILRTVVLRKGACVYDLMYVARPGNFSKQEPDFGRFVSSLRIH